MENLLLFTFFGCEAVWVLSMALLATDHFSERPVRLAPDGTLIESRLQRAAAKLFYIGLLLFVLTEIVFLLGLFLGTPNS